MRYIAGILIILLFGLYLYFEPSLGETITTIESEIPLG